MVMQLACLLLAAVGEHEFLPLVSSDLFCYLLWSGALEMGCFTQVVGLLHSGHVELEYDPGGVRVVNC